MGSPQASKGYLFVFPACDTFRIHHMLCCIVICWQMCLECDELKLHVPYLSIYDASSICSPPLHLEVHNVRVICHILMWGHSTEDSVSQPGHVWDGIYNRGSSILPR